MAKWYPRLCEKQKILYDSPKTCILVTGARLSGKSWGIMHRVVRHLWRANPSRFAIITKTNRQGEEGVWSTLTGPIFNEWLDAGVCSEHADFGWIKTPRINNITKINYAVCRNRFGGESEVILFPIERSSEAEAKLLSTEFSGIWLAEAHLYDTPDIFRVGMGQLRLPGTPYDELLFMADCNPPKEGQKHWLYDRFYRRRGMEKEDFPPDVPQEDVEAEIELQQRIGTFEFYPEDNTLIDPRKLRTMRALYAGDREGRQRFVQGLWLADGEVTGIFQEVWDRNIHVVGDASSPDESEWEVLAPSSSNTAMRSRGHIQLVGGWDMGEVNHGWSVIQPWFNAKNELCFDILDELILINEKLPVERFAERVMRKMAEVEKFVEFEIIWQHFSDSSAMNFRATARSGHVIPNDDELTDAAIVSSVSDGKIELIGAAAVKKRGWQRRRANLLSQLLKDRRIRVSANCFEVIRMFEKLRKGVESKTGDYIAEGQDTKHAFDAVSYPISMMLIDELIDPRGPIVSRRGRRVMSV